MNAKWILIGIAAIFLVLACINVARNGGQVSIAARTWLLVALILGGVSGVLFFTQ
jgi:hypothetical protein